MAGPCGKTVPSSVRNSLPQWRPPLLPSRSVGPGAASRLGGVCVGGAGSGASLGGLFAPVSVASVCSGLWCVFNQVAFILLSVESSLYVWTIALEQMCPLHTCPVRGFPSCSLDSVLCRIVFSFSAVSWSVFSLMGHVVGGVSGKVVTTPGSPRFLVSCLPGGCRCAAHTQLCDPESVCVRVSSASGPFSHVVSVVRSSGASVGGQVTRTRRSAPGLSTPPQGLLSRLSSAPLSACLPLHRLSWESCGRPQTPFSPCRVAVMVFCLQINFKISWSVATKRLAGVLTGLVWSL